MKFIAVLLMVAASMVRADTGLDFPDNASTSDNNASSPRFRWVNPQLNGLPLYGPGGQGVTYIWNYYPKAQGGYYTTFFWANDDGDGDLGTFLWDGGNSNTYYGAHPYPCSSYGGHDTDCSGGGSSSGTTHYWEVSAHSEDYVDGRVVNNQWYTQALVVWEDSSNRKHHEFYWDLPNVDANHVVSWTSNSSYGNTDPPSPALTWGDAPWQPGRELGHGIHRGIRIYNKRLSESDILSEATAALSTAEGAGNIWYLNMNPSPTDISDKSGKGHHPSWVSGVRPTLWESAGPSTPDPPTNLGVE